MPPWATVLRYSWIVIQSYPVWYSCTTVYFDTVVLRAISSICEWHIFTIVQLLHSTGAVQCGTSANSTAALWYSCSGCNMIQLRQWQLAELSIPNSSHSQDSKDSQSSWPAGNRGCTSLVIQLDYQLATALLASKYMAHSVVFIINWPGLAEAILQRPLLHIHPFSQWVSHPFPPNLQNIITPKPLELGTWNF